MKRYKNTNDNAKKKSEQTSNPPEDADRVNVGIDSNNKHEAIADNCPSSGSTTKNVMVKSAKRTIKLSAKTF